MGEFIGSATSAFRLAPIPDVVKGALNIKTPTTVGRDPEVRDMERSITASGVTEVPAGIHDLTRYIPDFHSTLPLDSDTQAALRQSYQEAQIIRAQAERATGVGSQIDVRSSSVVLTPPPPASIGNHVDKLA